MMVVERSSPLSQSSEATIETDTVDWDVIDAEFSAVICSIHFRLSSGEIQPTEAADKFSILLKAHLDRFSEPMSGVSV